MKNKAFLTASLICADQSNLEYEVKKIEKGGADYLHFDAMDGLFVPRFGMYPEQLKSIKKYSKLPVDAHLMIENPGKYVDLFADSGADILSIHIEADRHINHTISKIKSKGIKAGVVLNPATPLSSLEYILDDVDLIMLMAINPGILGHKLIPSMLNKIKSLKKMIGSRKILIEVDGGVTYDSAPIMIENGADMLVCGSSTIFKQDSTVDKEIIKFRKFLNTK